MAQKGPRPREFQYAVARPTADEIIASGARLNRASVNFLKIDVATALTFSEIALQTPDSEKQRRNRRSARKAYDTVLRLMGRVSLTKDDAQSLSRNLQRLKSELVRLGETFGETGKSEYKKTA
jgi:hypothetical protein